MKYMYIIKRNYMWQKKVNRIWLKGEITVDGSEDSIFLSCLAYKINS